jgi:hypothetical protein
MAPELIDPWRHVLGLALAFSWIKSALLTLRAHEMPYSGGVARGRLPKSRLVPLLAVGALLQLVFIEAWVLRWHALWLAPLILAMQGGVRLIEQRQWPSDHVVRLGKYAPASAALLAHWVVLMLTGSEAAGWEAAAGVMGATLSLAALAKWREAGTNWFKASGMGLLVAERAAFGPAPLRWTRRQVAGSRRLSAACSQIGMGLEAAGVLFIFPSLRLWLAGAVVALLVNFYVLLGYVEEEWMLALIAVTALSTLG